MNKEISRKPLIGIVGYEDPEKGGMGRETGMIIARRGGILVFAFGSYPTYSDSSVAIEAASGARIAGGETLGIITASGFSVQDNWGKEYATWILISRDKGKRGEYQTLASLCDAIIGIGLDLSQQSILKRITTSRIPLIEAANPRWRSFQRLSLLQLAENPRAAVDSAIAQIMGRRKGE